MKAQISQMNQFTGAKPNAIVTSLLSKEFWEATQTGKFIVISHQNTIHVVFSSLDLTPYHADIVYKYLTDNRLAEAQSTGTGSCHIQDSDWDVSGGGLFLYQPKEKILSLMEKSTAYGKYPMDLLKLIQEDLANGLNLNGFTIQFL